MLNDPDRRRRWLDTVSAGVTTNVISAALIYVLAALAGLVDPPMFAGYVGLAIAIPGAVFVGWLSFRPDSARQVQLASLGLAVFCLAALGLMATL